VLSVEDERLVEKERVNVDLVVGSVNVVFEIR
jgi:hypothetical protein